MRFPVRLLCCLIAAACCSTFLPTFADGKTVEIPSQWVQTPLKIDGARADWPERSILFFADQEAFIGVCNDSTNLYLVLHFRDADWARWIRMGGLTVYLDAEGKKGKDFKLKFTGGPTMKEIMAASGKSATGQTGRMSQNRDEKMPGMNDNIENPFLCYQKKYMMEKAIPMDGSEGPAVAGAMEKEFLVYEFYIPLKESTIKTFGLGAKPDKPVGVGFIWGDMEMKRPEGMGGGPGGGGGGMPPGGGPGGGGGGMPPGGGPGGGPRENNQPEKQEIWVKVQLSNPNQESGATEK
ncbi:MAG: hypothetical protein PHR28_09615 [candidate division Zixibacteria bacterium]|nr:hypothetical protein [candidate division Zixibacteria bacterium]